MLYEACRCSQRDILIVSAQTMQHILYTHPPTQILYIVLHTSSADNLWEKIQDMWFVLYILMAKTLMRPLDEPLVLVWRYGAYIKTLELGSDQQWLNSWIACSICGGVDWGMWGCKHCSSYHVMIIRLIVLNIVDYPGQQKQWEHYNGNTEHYINSQYLILVCLSLVSEHFLSFCPNMCLVKF